MATSRSRLSTISARLALAVSERKNSVSAPGIAVQERCSQTKHVRKLIVVEGFF
jgi:hypothetical protein